MNNLNTWKVIILVAASVFSLSALAQEGIKPICENGKSFNKTKSVCVDNDRQKNGATNLKPIQNEPKPGLLLPAVQAAREAPRTKPSTGLKPIVTKLSTGNSSATADTTCSGVNSCNDMIATCIALGGNVSPTGYDGETGAPNSATCYSPGN